MPSLKAKDRVSLCLFSFSDGRRCRSPRLPTHPHFCFDHAQKEAQSLATQKLGEDLAYFFSGDYLTACDLSTALARLIPAVLRGDVKARAARTVAYMFQTLLQSIHLSKHEYTNAFGTDAWRSAVRHSVNENRDYLFPPKPVPAPKPAPPSAPAPSATVPAPSTPPTASVVTAPQPAPASNPRAVTHSAAPPQASTLRNCHSEHSQEEPVFSSSPAPSPIPAQQLSSTLSSLPPQPSAAAHPFRSNARPRSAGVSIDSKLL
jgi:hypothetical protein